MNFPIGELARRTGVKVPTIRFYEQIGLLEPPPRTRGNQRRYGDADLDRLNFIRHARELGFEVADIRELLTLAATPESSCQDADGIAHNHLVAIELRIARLQVLRGELARMTEDCGHGRVQDCRVIEVLADHAQCASEHARA